MQSLFPTFCLYFAFILVSYFVMFVVCDCILLCPYLYFVVVALFHDLAVTIMSSEILQNLDVLKACLQNINDDLFKELREILNGNLRVDALRLNAWQYLHAQRTNGALQYMRECVMNAFETNKEKKILLPSS